MYLKGFRDAATLLPHPRQMRTELVQSIAHTEKTLQNVVTAIASAKQEATLTDDNEELIKRVAALGRVRTLMEKTLALFREDYKFWGTWKTRD
jgi:hypothetical protein